MVKFFRNWNFKKHFALVISFYSILLAIGNSVLLVRTFKKSERKLSEETKWVKYISDEEKKKAVAKSYICEPSKSCKIVNGILGACFITDMASYPIIKKMLRKL